MGTEQSHAPSTAQLDKAQVRIESLRFSNGSEVAVPENGVLVIVGPNNAGKSKTLRDIFAKLVSSPTPPIVCEPRLSIEGDWEALERVLSAYTLPHSPSHFSGPNFSFDEGSARHWWSHGQLNTIGNVFGVLLDTASRLTSSGPVPSHAVGSTNPTNAFQMLYEDDKLQVQIASSFRDVFRSGLVINPLAGSEITLHVGEPPSLEPGENLLSKSYVKKIIALPRLQEQGDGMKSFAAMLLAVSVFPRPIILIDEPEAFLHPPQERRIGRFLGSANAALSQVIVATHSEDVIQGLLTSAPERVSIVRLTRDGDHNKAKPLANEQVAELWKSPILRYSNILSGLFHEGVIIAEGDGDCRFYEAVQEALPPRTHAPDFFYTHCGGKDRMPVLVAALTALEVPVRAVADVDVLREEDLLKTLVQTLGGDWEVIAPSWNATKKAIEARKNWLRAGDLKLGIDKLLDALDKEDVVTKDVNKDIVNLTKQTSPWDEIKRNGLPGPLSGQAAKTALTLLADLRSCGLFVVPVGEMERFVPTVGGHGPRWVEGALEKDLANDKELENARQFVSDLVGSFR